MNKHIFPLMVAAALLVLTGGRLQAHSLTIGILGDQTGSPDLEQSYRIMAQGIETLNREKVDLVLHVGDLLESSREEAEIRRDFHTATTLLSRLHKPWYMTPGDHDVNPPQRVADSPDRSRETLFQELIATVVPEAADRLYYSFDHGGYHFVALNSQEHLHADPRWGNTFLARISQEQQQWLKDDLHQHRQATGTIVFLHQPLWYNWAGWLPVHQVLKEHGVLAVLAGHFHYDQDDGELDGIRYRVIGASGASIKNASRNAGGMHQVGVLTLENRNIKYKLLDAQTGEKVRFTPRADADRVQAVDYALGALSGFADANRFFLQNNQLVDTCTTEQPAEIRLYNIGNPIDLPVTFEIEVDSAAFTLTGPRFAEGLCRHSDNGLHCDLPPGAGIAVSNPSTASACFPTCPTPVHPETLRPVVALPKPVWSSFISPTSGQEFKEDTRLQMQVRMYFQAEEGQMMVQRSVQSQPLRHCSEGQP